MKDQVVLLSEPVEELSRSVIVATRPDVPHRAEVAIVSSGRVSVMKAHYLN